MYAIVLQTPPDSVPYGTANVAGLCASTSLVVSNVLNGTVQRPARPVEKNGEEILAALNANAPPITVTIAIAVRAILAFFILNMPLSIKRLNFGNTFVPTRL